MSDSPYDPPQTSSSPEAEAGYRTAPLNTDRMPPGIVNIIGNEAAERFSFYGMKTILTVFMTKYMLDATGAPAPFSDAEAKEWVHLFGFAVYAFPVLGAILSDWLWGKYPTIIWLSLLYCVGHGVLALLEFPVGDPRMILFSGLLLISIGAGGIKPCVSAHVGDQFGARNKHLLPRVYAWFYFAINFGSMFSTILTPLLLARFGPGWAFGVPGILMGLATLLFWMGRKKFAHIPPAGPRFFAEAFSPVGLRALANLAPLYLFVAMFWALFDQTASAWVLQADAMNRVIFTDAAGESWELLSSQIQAANPLFVLMLIPLFSYVIYPWLGRLVALTPLRKIGIGMFLTVIAFAIPAIVQGWIDAGATPSIWWQVLAYLTLTAAEVMVSITVLEFSYTQAPRSMKSIVMACNMLSVSIGNLFTALVNNLIKNSEGQTLLAGASYYWFFTATMLGAAVLFAVWSRFYRGETYIQGEGT